jgi:hypothetical protein
MNVILSFSEESVRHEILRFAQDDCVHDPKKKFMRGSCGPEGRAAPDLSESIKLKETMHWMPGHA